MPPAPIQRPTLLDQLLPELRRGGSVVLLGGHGIGKSVLLRQLADALRPDARVVVLPNPPVPCTVDRCLAVLAREFGVESPFDFSDLFSQVFARDATPVVLLYDEADVYSRAAEAGDRVGRALFDALESVRREEAPRLAVLIAGGLALFGLRESIGSNFLSRASWVNMRPLSTTEFDALSQPLRAHRTQIQDDVMDAVRIASGRNAALATYGFGRLWDVPEPIVGDVVSIFAEFVEKHGEFTRDFWKKIEDPQLSRIPRAIWECLISSGSAVSRDQLLSTLNVDDSIEMGLDDGLRILQSAGLIEIEGTVTADPLVARPILSILSLPKSRSPNASRDFRERLENDLKDILSHIHSLGVDFMTQRGIVPEAVFSATLAIALRLHGWRVEREAVRGSGRTDLTVEHPGLAGKAVVEVKIWGRNDYKEIQTQVASYCASGTTCAFAVTFSADATRDWKTDYATVCLSTLRFEELTTNKCEFACRVPFVTDLGEAIDATHLLVRIPRRT